MLLNEVKQATARFERVSGVQPGTIQLCVLDYLDVARMATGGAPFKIEDDELIDSEINVWGIPLLIAERCGVGQILLTH